MWGERGGEQDRGEASDHSTIFFSGREGGGRGRLLLQGGERGGSWEAVTSPCGQLSLLSWRPHPVHIQWVLGDKLRGTAHKVS